MATKEAIAIMRDQALKNLGESAAKLADKFGVPVPDIPQYGQDRAYLQATQLEAVAKFLAALTEIDQGEPLLDTETAKRIQASGSEIALALGIEAKKPKDWLMVADFYDAILAALEVKFVPGAAGDDSMALLAQVDTDGGRFMVEYDELTVEELSDLALGIGVNVPEGAALEDIRELVPAEAVNAYINEMAAAGKVRFSLEFEIDAPDDPDAEIDLRQMALDALNPDYEHFTVADLRDLAKDRGIDVPSKARRDDIIALLKAPKG